MSKVLFAVTGRAHCQRQVAFFNCESYFCLVRGEKTSLAGCCLRYQANFDRFKKTYMKEFWHIGIKNKNVSFIFCWVQFLQGGLVDHKIY